MTMVELMIAVFIVLVGVLAALLSLNASRRLTLNSQRKVTMAYKAAYELDRLRSIPYANLAFSGTPPSGDQLAALGTNDPDHYLSGTSPNVAFQYDRSGAACPPPSSGCEYVDVDATNGQVSPTPQPWSDGAQQYYVYDFVDKVPTDACGASCMPTGAAYAYKRITVAVVGQVPNGHQPAPVYLSTIIASPNNAAST